MINRRHFLKTGTALSLPLFSGGLAADPVRLFSAFAHQAREEGRVLVIVQLAGGNDGLNTVIGFDQYANLAAVRPEVVIPRGQVLETRVDTIGFHPRAGGLRKLFDDGRLNLVQGVGYPGQNRSHFRSTDIWTSGSEATVEESRGWLGRYNDLSHPGFPNGYPNRDFPYPLAMTMGFQSSATCQGIGGNYSHAAPDPESFLYIAPGGDTPLPDNYYGEEVGYVRRLIGQSNAYGTIVQAASDAGRNLSERYTNGSLSRQLRAVARLIDGGLETPVYVTTLGGFDTHNNQGTRHAALMLELSESLAAFQEDLLLLGRSNRVLGMTMSEFGRRIRDNASAGTDHGDAAPLFLFGECIGGDVLGRSPDIDREVDQSTGVAMQHDFRDIYGSVLLDWFGAKRGDVDRVLGTFTHLPILNGCAVAGEPFAFTATSADARQDQSILLRWQGRNENGGSYAVERSRNRQTTAVIGRRQPRGDGHTYRLADSEGQPGRTYHYRIQYTDADGIVTTSEWVTARVEYARESPREFTVGDVSPNPLTDASSIDVQLSTGSEVSLLLLDLNGRLVRRSRHRVEPGVRTTIGFPAHRLPGGTYVLRVTAEAGQRATRKVIVR